MKTPTYPNPAPAPTSITIDSDFLNPTITDLRYVSEARSLHNENFAEKRRSRSTSCKSNKLAQGLHRRTVTSRVDNKCTHRQLAHYSNRHQSASVTMPYDPNSGLVFSETVVKQSRKEFYRIKRQTKSLGARVEYVPPEHGPATLVELSMLTILRSLGMLDDNSLSTVPPTLLEKIWKSIVRS